GGISRFDPASGAFENFRAARGATRLELANGVGARLRGGQLVFGGTGGLVRFHPDSAGARAYRPPVRLTSVRFFDREVLPDAPERAGRGLRVPPTERYVSFEFAALDLLAPERIRYRYRLDGFDPGWSEPSAARTATYTNLPPGKYTFHVQATNAAGVWNAAPLRVPVVVVPPLWRRAWFQGLAGLLLAGGFAATVRYASTRRLRARLRALEAERRVQAERLRISRDLHDHVGAQMATLLSAAELVRLSARAGDEAGAQRYAEVVTADAHEAMRQIRIAAASLRAEALTPAELAARIEADARTRLRLPSAPALHVSVRVDEACQEVPLPPERALHLQRIAEEAVTNVLRHAGASRLDVCLHVAPGRVRLMVQDDGRGFAADTPAPGDGRPAGSGLLNMHARARESGGHVTVRAVPGAGTAVEVEVPLR
ncbi:MAG TPA: triple tyrosine motif-containing protein, partial [Rhodothermales bacterium]|nr:triple tyrosine motif-containing protein [Rhodothermales bacterium]